MQGYAARPLDIALSLISLLGNVEVDAVLALLVGMVRVRSGNGRVAPALCILLVAGTVAEFASKKVIPHPAVPRAFRRAGLNPTHHLFPTRYGFPRGHAFRTLFLAGALWPALKRGRLLWGVPVVAATAGVQVGLVYLGDHWTSEVIAGDLLAGVCLGLLEAVGSWKSGGILRTPPRPLFGRGWAVPGRVREDVVSRFGSCEDRLPETRKLGGGMGSARREENVRTDWIGQSLGTRCGLLARRACRVSGLCGGYDRDGRGRSRDSARRCVRPDGARTAQGGGSPGTGWGSVGARGADADLRYGHWTVEGRWEGPRRVFGEIRPAATMVEVRRLVDPEMLVEIEADVVLPEEGRWSG